MVKIAQARPQAGPFLGKLRSARKCSKVEVCASSCIGGGLDILLADSRSP